MVTSSPIGRYQQQTKTKKCKTSPMFLYTPFLIGLVAQSDITGDGGPILIIVSYMTSYPPLNELIFLPTWRTGKIWETGMIHH